MFGENHILEMAAKAAALPKDIEWHFTGHVQTNKIKYMAPFVSLIHAVDSFRLLREIDKHAAKHDRVIDCLLQIHIAQEDTKYGFTIDECRTMLATEPWRELRHVRITGLMAMGSNTDDMEQVRSEFRQMKMFFDELRSTHFASSPTFCQLSEGMTDDYPIAIEEGSTIVRIGSMIFGERSH
jgi:pyridoxal phosphate enzyme (YggS family)